MNSNETDYFKILNETNVKALITASGPQEMSQNTCCFFLIDDLPFSVQSSKYVSFKEGTLNPGMVIKQVPIA